MIQKKFFNLDTVCVVAEIGINHNGDLNLAKESIEAAAQAGAHAVKFQNYKTEDFIGSKDLTLTYESQGRMVVESQYDLFKRCELTRDNLIELSEYTASKNIMFQSTPTSLEGIEDLKLARSPVLKNGSDFLTNHRIIRAMGESGLPTVLSTGMATLAEIDEAVRIFTSTGNTELLLLLCTSSYPTSPEEVNLARLDSLRTAFMCPIGFSDHTIGSTAAVGAVVKGARWIEKHFTLSHDLPGPDHWFSMMPDDLTKLVSDISDAEKMVGYSAIGPTKSEIEGRELFRLSCVATTQLSAGHQLRPEDIAFKRPGTGLPPVYESLLVGRIVTREILAGELFELECLS